MKPYIEIIGNLQKKMVLVVEGRWEFKKSGAHGRRSCGNRQKDHTEHSTVLVILSPRLEASQVCCIRSELLVQSPVALSSASLQMFSYRPLNLGP